MNRLLPGHLSLDMVAQFLGGDVRAWLGHHRGADLLAERRMRQADHGRLGDRRVLMEHLLDLPRVHVVTAAEPAVGNRLGRIFGPVLLADNPAGTSV